MPPRRSAFLLVPALAVALAACGSDKKPSASVSPTATLTTAAAQKAPPLGRIPLKSGELLFSGDAAPASHGAFKLDGRYLVRFEQFAPEDAKKDFSGETPFTASLRRAKSIASGFKLFGAKRSSGQRVVTRHGRYVLDVTFGDFPYAVRFTPQK
ncbi:MAG: hypothetical protein QOJ46_2728 [bacterium]|jgi:hypothetical protein